MEEFTKDYYRDQAYAFENTLNIISRGGDKFSINAIANICVFMKDFNKLVGSLINDVESGKIGKTPRRLKNWKKRNMIQHVENTEEEKNKDEISNKPEMKQDMYEFYK
jgi:hypothetical protein